MALSAAADPAASPRDPTAAAGARDAASLAAGTAHGRGHRRLAAPRRLPPRWVFIALAGFVGLMVAGGIGESAGGLQRGH